MGESNPRSGVQPQFGQGEQPRHPVQRGVRNHHVVEYKHDKLYVVIDEYLDLDEFLDNVKHIVNLHFEHIVDDIKYHHVHATKGADDDDYVIDYDNRRGFDDEQRGGFDNDY